MEKQVVEIKGNLHLFGVNSYSARAFGALLVEEHGISLSLYHCGDSIPDGVLSMQVDDFIAQYKGCKVEVEGDCVCFGYNLKGE